MVLQQALRSLCCGTGWCYAVFWKLKRRSRMVLTWEDGYCEYKKLPSSLVVGSCLDTGGIPRTRACRQGGSCLEDQISLALANLSYQVYSLGEGIVGRVAFNGKHQWLHNDGARNKLNGGNHGSENHKIFKKYSDGWQNQFAAGIKTIAVIAVSQGVVQLGSMETIMEDLHLVDQIKSSFVSLQGVQGAFHSETLEGQGRKGQLQSTAILPIEESPTAAMGRSIIMPQVHVGKRASDCVSGATVNWSQYGLLNTFGSCNESSNLQSFSPFSKVNPARISMPEPLPQQSFLQARSGNNLEGLLAADCKLHNAFAGSLQANVSKPGMKQLFSFNTPMARNDFKHMKQLSVSCPLEQHALSSRKIITDLSQALGDASTSNAQDTGQTTGKLAVESQKDQQITAGSMLEVLQWNSASSSIEIAAGYDHTGGILQYQPLAGESQTNLSLTKNVGFESHNHLLLQGNASNNKSTLQKGPPSSSYCLPTDPIPCLEGIMESFESHNQLLFQGNANINNSTLQEGQPSSSSYKLPTDPIPCLEGIMENLYSSTSHFGACVNNSMRNQKGWDIVNKEDAFYSPLQNTAKMSGQTKWDALESQSICSDVPCGTEFNCIDTGEFDDIENYITSIANKQENLNSPFPVGDELSEALGPAFKRKYDGEFWEEVLFQTSRKKGRGPGKLGLSSSIRQADTEISQSWGSTSSKNQLSNGISASTMYSMENKSESLLDAVVGTSSINQTSSQILDNAYSSKLAFSGSECGLSILNPIVKSFNANVDKNFTNKMQGNLMDEDKREHLHAGIISESQENIFLHKPVESFCKKTATNSWVEEGKCKKSNSAQHSQAKKLDEISKNNGKRGRPGESTRPRPKDRQQIQDRIHELRAIVPNGSKCSIDSLLEKTINHMRFLQSVTQHADKLKQIGELKSELESGASWALELDSQIMECPIVVENLNQPRHMRVEMLCEERGFFLEIADIIRGLGLTIMKGIMESRGDKIRARFVVEANRDVHRIEILWSLMQLLQPSPKSVSSITTAFSDVLQA